MSRIDGIMICSVWEPLLQLGVTKQSGVFFIRKEPNNWTLFFEREINDFSGSWALKRHHDVETHAGAQ
jgi:hypothetical protein